MTWTIVFANRPDFDAFVKKLPDEHQEAVSEALAVELAKYGPEICKRSLGNARLKRFVMHALFLMTGV